jgi:hypothetical protein
MVGNIYRLGAIPLNLLNSTGKDLYKYTDETYVPVIIKRMLVEYLMTLLKHMIVQTRVIQLVTADGPHYVCHSYRPAGGITKIMFSNKAIQISATSTVFSVSQTVLLLHTTMDSH